MTKAKRAGKVSAGVRAKASVQTRSAPLRGFVQGSRVIVAAEEPALRAAVTTDLPVMLGGPP